MIELAFRSTTLTFTEKQAKRKMSILRNCCLGLVFLIGLQVIGAKLVICVGMCILLIWQWQSQPNLEQACFRDVHQAIRNGHMEVLKVLVVHFGDAFDVNQTDWMGYTAVHLATKSGHVNIVKYLLQQFKDVFNINVSKSTYFTIGDTVLHLAARDGHVNMVKAILEHYKDVINVNKLNNCGDTFLHLAAGNGHVNMVNAMLEHYKDDIFKIVNEPNNAGDTVLHLAARNGHVNIVKVMLEHYKDDIVVNKPTKSGDTVLHLAARYGHVNIVKVMLEHYKDDIDVNKHNRKGRTAIYIATAFDSLPIVQVLVSNFGTNIDMNNRIYGLRKKSAPLDIAIWNGNMNIVELFILKTSSPVQVSSLIVAIQQNKSDLAKLIHGKIHTSFKDDIKIIVLFSRYFELIKEVLKPYHQFKNEFNNIKFIIKKELKTKYGDFTRLTNDESEPIKEELDDVAKIIILNNIYISYGYKLIVPM
jgi:ankyrin repeat protein